MTIPSPPATDQYASTPVSLSLGVTFMSPLKIAGMSSAAASPMITRPPISIQGPSASAATVDPAVNATRPSTIENRRPRRSASNPKAIRRLPAGIR